MNQDPKNLPVEDDPYIQEYRQFVLSLESTQDEELKVRIDHATDGLVTEAGELKDLMKKIKFQGASIPRINFLDEMADDLHYLVMLMNVLGVTFADLMRLNRLKLKTRYPKGFTPEDSKNRNTIKEQKEMEKSVDNTEETIS